MAAPRRDTAVSERFDGARFLIIEGRFYNEINDMLVAGARRAFEAAYPYRVDPVYDSRPFFFEYLKKGESVLGVDVSHLRGDRQVRHGAAG